MRAYSGLERGGGLGRNGGWGGCEMARCERLHKGGQAGGGAAPLRLLQPSLKQPPWCAPWVERRGLPLLLHQQQQRLPVARRRLQHRLVGARDGGRVGAALTVEGWWWRFALSVGGWHRQRRRPGLAWQQQLQPACSRAGSVLHAPRSHRRRHVGKARGRQALQRRSAQLRGIIGGYQGAQLAAHARCAARHQAPLRQAGPAQQQRLQHRDCAATDLGAGCGAKWGGGG